MKKLIIVLLLFGVVIIQSCGFPIYEQSYQYRGLRSYDNYYRGYNNYQPQFFQPAIVTWGLGLGLPNYQYRAPVYQNNYFPYNNYQFAQPAPVYRYRR